MNIDSNNAFQFSGPNEVSGGDRPCFFAAAEKVSPDRNGAEQGLIFTSGDVLSEPDTNKEVPHWQREFIHQQEKEAIAREARKLVAEGDTIILDASSTSWFLAQRLPDMPLTVITNAVHISNTLQGYASINVVCLGGVFMENSMSNVGLDTIRRLHDYHADKAFISCRGYDRTFGVSDCAEEQTVMRRKMLEISDEHILMLDSSKWNKRASSVIVPINAFHHVITDDRTPSADYRHVHEMGIQVTGAKVY